MGVVWVGIQIAIQGCCMVVQVHLGGYTAGCKAVLKASCKRGLGVVVWVVGQVTGGVAVVVRVGVRGAYL